MITKVTSWKSVGLSTEEIKPPDVSPQPEIRYSDKSKITFEI